MAAPPAIKVAVEAYLSNAERIKNNMGFEELVGFLKEGNVIQTTKDCTTLILNEAKRHGLPAPSVEHINARVLLSAFMSALHPGECFRTYGQQEAELCKAAKDYLAVMETACIKIRDAGDDTIDFLTPDLAADFQGKICTYVTLLEAWKAIDRVHMRVRLQRALVSLYHAYDIATAHGQIDPLIEDQFKHQIDRLQNKFKNWYGEEALEQLKAGIRMRSVTFGVDVAA